MFQFFKKHKLFVTFSIILVLSILARVFLFEIMLIPSASMENTILTGDIIVMDKLSCGTRFFNGDTVERSWAYDTIRNGDILIFNLPVGDTVMDKEDCYYSYYYEYVKQVGREKIIANPTGYGHFEIRSIENRKQYVKRCIGIPGDLLEIKKNVVFINQQSFSEPSNRIQSKEFYYRNMKEWNEQQQYPKNKRAYDEIFPNDFSAKWSRSNFGPLFIPKKGISIQLDSSNISLYYRVMTAYENNTIEMINSKIYVNGKESTNYTFKKNYYFVMGDNRSDSFDSRNWGFLPEDHVKGKVVMVLCSFGNVSGQWKRILKPLN